MENMEIWNNVNQPPTSMLKEIKAGRLKGKSDINPQWRYQALTENFGPCGQGWKYTINKVWSVEGSDKQVFAFAEISLYVKLNGEWSEPIPGIGGSMLIEKESKGLHANDEGYKMAVTDALSVACKMLGIAADVYAGLWDGSKYITTDEKNKNGNTKDKKSGGNGDRKPLITEDQLKKVRTKIDKQESFNSEEKKRFFDFMKEKSDKIFINDKWVITQKGFANMMNNFDSLLSEFMSN